MNDIQPRLLLLILDEICPILCDILMTVLDALFTRIVLKNAVLSHVLKQEILMILISIDQSQI